MEYGSKTIPGQSEGRASKNIKFAATATAAAAVTAAAGFQLFCSKTPGFIQVEAAKHKRETQSTPMRAIEPWKQLNSSQTQTAVIVYSGDASENDFLWAVTSNEMPLSPQQYVFVPQAGFIPNLAWRNWTSKTDTISKKLAQEMLAKNIKNVICIGYALGSLGSSFFVKNLLFTAAQQNKKLSLTYISFDGLNSFSNATKNVLSLKPPLAPIINRCDISNLFQANIISNLKYAMRHKGQSDLELKFIMNEHKDNLDNSNLYKWIKKTNAMIYTIDTDDYIGEAQKILIDILIEQEKQAKEAAEAAAKAAEAAAIAAAETAAKDHRASGVAELRELHF